MSINTFDTENAMTKNLYLFMLFVCADLFSVDKFRKTSKSIDKANAETETSHLFNLGNCFYQGPVTPESGTAKLIHVS